MRRMLDRRDRPGWSHVTNAGFILALALGGSPTGAAGQEAKAVALLERVIAAHGGMAAWVNVRDVTFTIARIGLDASEEVMGASASLYSLKRDGKIRVETVTGKGLLVQGFDGQRPWVTLGGRPEASAEALKRAHFQSVNWWYWIGIPFKLKDPGVILRHAGRVTLGGKPTEVLEVSFQPGVGATNDRFTYSIDPETHHILFVEVQLEPGVWPGVGGPTPSRSAWLDYQTEGPFTLPTKRIVYADPDLRKKRAIALFRDFRFNVGLPDSLFVAP